MTYTLEFKLPGLPKTTNGSHGHWRAKHKQTTLWKSMVVMAVGEQKPAKPLEKAIAKFTRHSSSEPDDDNLRISFKAVRDGLILAGVIVDDKRKNLHADYDWQPAPPGKGFITVKVEGVA